MDGLAYFQGERITKLQKSLTKFKKKIILKNHWTNLNQIWHKAFLGEEKQSFFQMDGPALFQGERITKLQKYINKIKKSSSQEPLNQFQPNLAQSSLGWRGLKLV